MSIRSKIMMSFVAVLALFVAVTLVTYRKSQAATDRLALVNDLFLPLSRQVAQIQSHVQGLAEDMRRFYFRTENNPENSSFATMVRDLYPYLIQKRFVAAEQLLESTKSGVIVAHRQELLRLLSDARKRFDTLTATHHRDKFEQEYQALRSQFTQISKRLDEECQSITLAAQREGRDNVIASLFLSGFLILSALLMLMFTHRVLNPLPMLVSSLRKIADGDFHQSLKVKGAEKDEVSLLAREYNRMLHALSERDEKIHKQQQEILNSERLAAIGQLSAEVVHEIRNPLNAISLNIDWLQHELRELDPEVNKTLASIAKEVVRLHQITESYLARARVPTGSKLRAPVNEVIQEIIEFAQKESQAEKISIEAELSERELFVSTDRSRLKQAFLNVLKNAREAMPHGGTIRVRTEVRDNLYRVLFSDTGSGMSETTRQRTFDPFFTTKTNGTGLGLAVTKSIVEEANGNLSCESRVGQGTTFTFQFPA